MFDFLSVPNSLSSLTSKDDQKQVSTKTSEQFLRLHLVPDTTVLLPIKQLTEVLTIPIGEIVPIAHMPPWVMGVHNWRGEILWMVDLQHLIGLTPWHQQTMGTSNHTAVVLNISSQQRNSTKNNSQILGLIVNRVEDIEWCNPDLIQSPPTSGIPELEPFLRGYWVKSTGEILVVLDGKSIVARMPH